MSYLLAQVEETPRYFGAPATSPYRLSSNKFFIPGISGSIAENASYDDRDNEIRNNLSPTPKTIARKEPGGAISLRMYPNQLVPFLLAAGFTATIQSGAGTNEVQSVAQGGTWTGGTFTLSFGGEVTQAIPYNATAAQVQRFLERLSTIGPGSVSCAGGPLPGSAVSVTFVGDLSATNVAALVGDPTNLTGTAPAVTITTTTPGVAGAVTDPDGKGLATGSKLWTFAKRTGAVAKSLQLIAAFTDDGIYWKSQGMGVQRIGFGADGTCQVDLVGLYAVPISDPGETPSYDALTVLPLNQGDLTVTTPAGTAESSDFSTAIQNPLERPATLWGKRWPKELLHGPVVSASGSIGKSRMDQEDIDLMRDATQFSAKARWRNPQSKIGSSGEPYALFHEVDGAQLIGGGGEAMANKRRHSASFEWFAGYNESLARDIRLSLVCATTVAETYP